MNKYALRLLSILALIAVSDSYNITDQVPSNLQTSDFPYTDAVEESTPTSEFVDVVAPSHDDAVQDVLTFNVVVYEQDSLPDNAAQTLVVENNAFLVPIENGRASRTMTNVPLAGIPFGVNVTVTVENAAGGSHD